MKKIKIFLLLVLGYSLGEFITQWRLHPEPITFREYIKLTVIVNKRDLKQAFKAGETLADSPRKGVEMINDLAFPYRNQN